MSKGTLLISLDFELFWGVHDCHTYDTYGENVLGGRKAIPKLLEIFKKYDIHATWATVGMLFAENKDELVKFSPKENLQPHFDNKLLSSYRMFDKIGDNEESEPYFYGKSLIDLIAKYPNQEIGSHTFSHYYAREEGQNIDEFKADIKAAKNIAVAKGYDAKTLVFPRNQSKDEYESVMISNGYVAYRGEEQDWIHKIPVNPIKRIFRLADSYINLTGSATYSKDDFCPGKLHNFRGSRFLRPFNHTLCFLENLKLHRVKGQMKKAAKNGRIFHLWWHPHNIGINTERNLKNIVELLDYYNVLKEKYGFQSKNMLELSNEINNKG